jgi:hypothetical protein
MDDRSNVQRSTFTAGRLPVPPSKIFLKRSPLARAAAFRIVIVLGNPWSRPRSRNDPHGGVNDGLGGEGDVTPPTLVESSTTNLFVTRPG